MRTYFFIIITLTTFLYSMITNAWNALGHQVIAHIAYQQLEPAVKKKVDSMIADFNQEYPTINTIETLSVWPDALRSQKIEVYTHWHYIDMPIIDKGVDVHPEIDTDNAVWALQKIKLIVENNKANKYERARFLAFFVHIVSDLHQPLHTVALYSSKHPEGDRGGNDYAVYYQNKKTNLHSLWDKGVGAFDSPPSETTVTQIAKTLMHTYPKAYFAKKLDELNPNTWVGEGINNATNDVYATPEEREVSQQYIKNGKKLSEEEATLAGYRLGILLNQLLS